MARSLAGDLNEKGFKALAKYYSGRPELADYTIDHEVTRMAYVVTTADGDTLSTAPPSPGGGNGGGNGGSGSSGSSGGAAAVAAHFRAVANAGATELGTGRPAAAHLLLRMANQSLLADMLAALHE